MGQMSNSFKLRSFPAFLLLFVIASGFDSLSPAYRLVGVWESEEENLQIQMFEDHGQFSGRMIYYKCSSDDIMRSTTDVENPNEKLRHRKLLGLTLITNLLYQGDGVWDDGKIYDPNSGRTFEARIQLLGNNTAMVRGYWKYRWLGRTMTFNRKQ
jgi:uncharacterized protein (DUF2147 family)